MTDTETLRKETAFLLDRLASVEGYALSDEDARDFYGHVMPAIERTRHEIAALTPSPEAQADQATEPDYEADGLLSNESCIWQAEQIEARGWHPLHSQNDLARTLRDVVRMRGLLAHPPAPQPEAPTAQEQLKVMREALEDVDLIEQAIIDRTNDGATRRQIAEYVSESLLASVTAAAQEGA